MYWFTTAASPGEPSDYSAAARFWSPNYIQHSAHIEPGREGMDWPSVDPAWRIGVPQWRPKTWQPGKEILVSPASKQHQDKHSTSHACEALMPAQQSMLEPRYQ
jgi:hypothetical protein